MNSEVKTIMKRKVRLARGLVNILQDDVMYIGDGLHESSYIIVEESIDDIKDVIRQLTDVIVELEYMIYLTKNE